MFRYSQAVKTQDFDSCIAGSNPAAEATSCSTNNIEELLKLLTVLISFIGGFRPRFYFFYFIYLYHYSGNKY